LQIKGLLGDFEGIGQNISERNEYTKKDTEPANSWNIVGQESKQTSLGGIDSKDGTVAETYNDETVINNELEHQIEGMIEKNEGQWICKVCGKSSIKRCNAKSHAETHIEGVSHACHICSKTVSTRDNLRLHINKQHSDLFSCDICGKTGMNRGTYQLHKRRNHKPLSINSNTN